MPLNAVKKTQLGPGSTQRESPWEGWRGDGMRPACRSSTGRRGESDAALRGRHRTACLEAATQPRDGCAAGMRNGRGAWRTPTRVSEGPKRGVRFQPLRMCPGIRDGLRGAKARPLDRLTQREGVCPSKETIGRARLNPSGLTPGRLFGEPGSILCSRSRIRGTGTLQVSRHETLEKPETASIIPRTAERMEGPKPCCRPAERELLAPP